MFSLSSHLLTSCVKITEMLPTANLATKKLGSFKRLFVQHVDYIF